ncbi:type II secretion system protein GspL [Novosphingobium taihuense]|uniref:General secretion pathway protein L n=1 Tax=Novosphingobium taihuense TaxID=260085 RepID=A0A7W7ETG1_9SPHN|nr:type II secretion system protein GspL [Novosphingobium taihuense]MBB4612964.1 general secretion pathway protein L [Novosphingobium taihuense]TWH81848.1 general secretion pathway protein L [Novosphingobium taihuense]
MASTPPLADDLIVALPATPGEPWRWWRVGVHGLGPEHYHEPGTAQSPWGEVGTVTALVPSTDAPVTDKALPDMPPAQALAAERLALAQGSVITQPHVAVGIDNGRLLSCRVAASAMDHWLASLASEGLDPQALVPAALILPRTEGALVLASAGGQLLARSPDAAFAAEEALVSILAEGLEQVAPDVDALALRLAAVHAAPPLNLRQGIYAPRRVSVFRTADWVGLARMAATAALLALLLMLVWIVKWNGDSAAVESRALELAQKRFPAATDLDTAERLLATELGKRGEGGASFAAPTAALLEAMRPVPGVKLRDLGYGADGTLRFTAAAPRAEDVNAVLIALQNGGWKVTVPPALAPDPTGATVAAITVRAP